MAKYAATTRVPIRQSKVEIERTFVRYGIEEFFFGSSPRGEGIGFKYEKRCYQINIPMPDPDDYSTDVGCEQAKRQRWRILLLALKAKLELVDAGLVTFADEFLAQTRLPDGRTMSEYCQPIIQGAIEEGKMPKALLPGVG